VTLSYLKDEDVNSITGEEERVGGIILVKGTMVKKKLFPLNSSNSFYPVSIN
jgi:hypothetical protein